jgi:pyrimidine-specific ribonucleoside hydrolase
MRRKILIISGSILGMLVILFILAVPAAPLWVKMGFEPVCIQGNWPNFKVVSCPQYSPPSASVTSLPLPTVGEQGPIPLIVDDDGSPDGTVALLYFLRNPLFDVRAVTVSYGEAHPDIYARHMIKLLESLKKGDIPVGAGKDSPLEGSNAFPESWRENSNNFWGVRLPELVVTREPASAAELMVDIIKQSSQPVGIFVSGSHTNLAEAIRLEPVIKQNIRAVYIMGGSVYVPGNIQSDWPEIKNNAAEWNIWVDPVAAKEVFASGLSLHLVPLDATQQVIWTKDDLPEWTSSGRPESAVAGEFLQFMLNSWSEKGVYIWDLTAAIQASNPQVCPEVSLSLDVITTSGSEQGRTMVRDGAANTAACLNPDEDQVKAMAAYMFSH